MAVQCEFEAKLTEQEHAVQDLQAALDASTQEELVEGLRNDLQ